MLGRYSAYSWNALPGYGWTGITVAILAGNNPAFVPLAAFFMAYLNKGCLLMKLEGVEDMDAALALKGQPVSVRRSDVTLPEGVYFDQELVGLTARNAETGEALGTVEEVLSYPAHKVYAVRGGKDEYLIPAVPAFVKDINLTDGIMEIHVWEGMGSHED